MPTVHQALWSLLPHTISSHTQGKTDSTLSQQDTCPVSVAQVNDAGLFISTCFRQAHGGGRHSCLPLLAACPETDGLNLWGPYDSRGC